MRTLSRYMLLARLLVLPWLVLPWLVLPWPAHAQELSAYELLLEVEKCSLTLGGEAPKFDPEAQAMIVSVTSANVGPGITAHLFYFGPGKDGARDDFGLIFDAEPAVVAKALPQYAQPKVTNGYRRELTAIGDPDGSAQGKGKSLLVCRGQKS